MYLYFVKWKSHYAGEILWKIPLYEDEWEKDVKTLCRRPNFKVFIHRFLDNTFPEWIQGEGPNIFLIGDKQVLHIEKGS